MAWLAFGICALLCSGPAWGDESTAATTPPPPPMSPQAQAHYDRGLELYAAHQYGAAVDELRQGFAVEPRREFLFAQAQAFRLAGDCEHAIPLYRQFIDSGPSPLQAQGAGLGLDRCGPDRSAPPPPLHSTAAPPAPQSAAGLATSEPRPWWRDPWAGASLGASMIAFGLAAGFEVASERDQANAPMTATDPQYDQVWTRAQQRRKIAVTSLMAGAALLATGGLRLLVLHGRVATDTIASPGDPRVSLSAGDGSAILTWWAVF
jgi:hypothetical protein